MTTVRFHASHRTNTTLQSVLQPTAMGEMADYYGVEAGGYEAPSRPEPTKTIWVRKNGQRIPVREMSDSHLINTIRMLRRQAEPRKAAYEILLDRYMDDAPDGAWMAANSELTTLEDMDIDDYLESEVITYAAMLQEVERRKLTV